VLFPIFVISDTTSQEVVELIGLSRLREIDLFLFLSTHGNSVKLIPTPLKYTSRKYIEEFLKLFSACDSDVVGLVMVEVCSAENEVYKKFPLWRIFYLV